MKPCVGEWVEEDAGNLEVKNEEDGDKCLISSDEDFGLDDDDIICVEIVAVTVNGSSFGLVNFDDFITDVEGGALKGVVTGTALLVSKIKVSVEFLPNKENVGLGGIIVFGFNTNEEGNISCVAF